MSINTFAKWKGDPWEDIIGKTDFDLYPIELAKKYWKDDQYVLETGETLDPAEVHQTQGGEEFYVQVINSPYAVPEGRMRIAHRFIGGNRGT